MSPTPSVLAVAVIAAIAGTALVPVVAAEPAAHHPRPAALTAQPHPTSPSLARLTLTNGGQTVYDSGQKITWLADGDLAAKEKFNLANINRDGSMDYATAQKWVGGLNTYHNGAGYLGHHTWTLPTTPASDSTCSSRKKNTFGFNCSHSALGSLFYRALALHEPNTAVPIPHNTAGSFTNFQPYLYWSETKAAGHPENVNGYMSFSFNTGYQGSNVSPNSLYVLPMIRGKLPKPVAGTVYDANAGVTWLANANLAASQTFLLNAFGAVNRDGSMNHDTALQFVARMNAAHYLNQTKWQLPPTATSDSGCSVKQTFGFGCTSSPMGALYYKTLKKTKGTPVVAAPNVAVGPFHNVQPYLYWSCEGDTIRSCKGSPAPGFAWSFSFGDGFEGTDVVINDLYVTAYYPDEPVQGAAPAPRRVAPPKCPPGARCRKPL